MSFYKFTEEEAQAIIDIINIFPSALIRGGRKELEEYLVMTNKIIKSLQNPLQKTKDAKNEDKKE